MSSIQDLKALVLCAGEGTRLRPLTFSKPKHLLPVAGIPLLGHVLHDLSTAGLKQVGLVVGHRPEAVQRYVGDGEQWGMEASYITQDQPLGLAHAVKTARDYIGDSPFIVYLGDNLLEHGINDFVRGFLAHESQAALLLAEVEDPRRYGVAVLDQQGRVMRLVEKPAEPPSNLAIVGVYAFQSAIFEAIENIQPSARGELEITEAVQWLVDSGREVAATTLSGFWEDAGEPLALLRANRLYLDRSQSLVQGTVAGDCEMTGQVSVGRGTRIQGSRLLGPVLIGRNCVIENSTIGPYAALGDGCEVQNCVVEDSVVQDNCRLSGLRSGLVRSVLGSDVQVVGNGNGGGPLHLILGDMAQIRML